MNLSIIIPVLNSEKTIGKAISSILAQDFNDYEIIILDGISTDNTIEIVQSYKDARIKFYSERDKGIYDAMNKGIQFSEGDWLYFLGSDDYFTNKSSLSSVFQSIKNNTADIIYGKVYWGNEDEEYGKYFDVYTLFYNNICHQSIFYRRSVFDAVGLYNLKYPIFADWDLNCRCFFNQGIKKKYIDKIVAFYSREGISTKEIDDFLRDKRAIFQKNFEKLNLFNKFLVLFILYVKPQNSFNYKIIKFFFDRIRRVVKFSNDMVM